MTKNNKFLYFASLVLLLTSSVLHSQSVTWNNLNAETPLSICAESKTVTVPFQVNGGVLTSGVLEVKLPVGVSYDGGFSFSRSVGGAITYDNTSPSNGPRFNLGAVSNGENITIVFSQKAACSSAVGSVADTVSVFDGVTLVPSRQTIDYSVGAASLSINNVVNTPATTNANQTALRTVFIANQSGNGGFVNDFYYIEKYTAGLYQFDVNSFKIVGTNFSIPSSNIRISSTDDSLVVHFDAALIAQIGDGNAKFEVEDFQLSYSFLPTSCGLVASEGNVYWGCNTSVCQRASYVINHSVNQVTGANLVFTSYRPEKICIDVANEYRIRVINNSAGYAKNTVVKVWSGELDADRLFYHDTASVFYTVGINGSSIHPAMQNIVNNTNPLVYNALNNCNYAAKPREFEVLLPLIAPNDTVWITFNTFYCPIDNYVQFPPFDFLNLMDKPLKYSIYDVTYNDFCNNSYESSNNPLSANEVWAFGTSLNVPGTINAGETKPFITNVSAESYSYAFNSFNHPGAYFEITTILPAGIEFDDSQGDGVRWYDAARTSFWANANITVNTLNTLVVIFSAEDAINTINSEIELKLKGVDYTGSGGSCGLKTITQFIRYVPDPTNVCPTPIKLNVVKNTYDVYLKCAPTGPCEGLNLYNFTAKRYSLGNPDNDDNGLDDGSGVVDETKARLERVFLNDTIKVSFFSKIDTIATGNNSFSHVYANLRSSFLPGLGVFPLINYVSSNVTIKRDNGTTLTGNVAPTLAVSDASYRFDLSSIGSNTFKDNDSIFLDVYLVASFPIGNFVVSTSFNCDMYASLVADPIIADRYACGDPFINTLTLCGSTFTDDGSSGGDNTGNFLFFNECQDKRFSIDYKYKVGNVLNGGNFFPFEDRKFAYLDSVKLTLPRGYSIVETSVATNLRNAGNNLTAAEPTFSPLSPIRVNNNDYVFRYGDKYIQNGGSDMNISDDGWTLNHIYTIRPSGASVPNVASTMTVTSYFKGVGVVATNPFGSGSVTSADYSLYYNVPKKFAIAPLVASVNAKTDSVKWTGTLQKLLPSNAENSWIYLSSGSGLIEVDRVKLNNVVYNSNNGFYNFGTLSADASYEIKAIYRSCTKDSIKIYYGYDCFSYPTTFDEARAFAKDSAYFDIVPQTAQISATISSLISTPSDPSNGASAPYGRSTVDMCGEFPVEILINNSQPAVLSNVQALFQVPSSAGLAGLEFVAGSGYIEYPLNSTPRAFSAAANTALTTPARKINLAFDLAQIDPTNFAFSGLIGTDSLLKNKVKIRFKLKSNCNLKSGARYRALMKAKAPCGSPAVGNDTRVLGEKLNIVGATPSYETNMNLTLSQTELTTCLDTLTAALSIRKIGSNPVNVSDSVFLILPSAIDIMGGITCSGSACGTSTVSFNTLLAGDQRILSWAYPITYNTLPNNGNDSIVNYSFRLRFVAPNSSTGSTADIIAQVTQKVSLLCNGTIPCPNSEVVLGEDDEAINFKYPLIGVAKAASSAIRQTNGSYNASYTIILKNYGNRDLTKVRLLDTLSNTFPAPTVYSITTVNATSGVVLNPLYNGSTVTDLLDTNASNLAIAASDTIVVSVNIIPSAYFGPFYNSAYASGMDADGCRNTDISTNGTNPDPNNNGNPSDAGEDIPTPLLLPKPIIGVAKALKTTTQISDCSTNFTFELIVKNYGTDSLVNLQLVEDLNSFIGSTSTYSLASAPVATGQLTINSAFNGSSNVFMLDSTTSSIAVGDADTITFVLNIKSNQYFGPYKNSVLTRAKGYLTPDFTFDYSDDGFNPDANNNGQPNEVGENDTTIVNLDILTIGVAKHDSIYLKANGTYDVKLKIIVKNYGSDTLQGVQVFENLSRFITSPSTYSIVSMPVSTGNLTINTAFNGTSDTLLLDSALSYLETSGADTVEFTINISPNNFYGPFTNSVFAIGGRNGGITSDRSDDGDNPDSDGDGCPDEVGENDATLVTLNRFIAVQDNGSICADSLLTSTVAINDTYSGTVFFRLVAAPTKGTVNLQLTGTYTYTPGAEFAGVDTFAYAMCDNSFNQFCDTALVIITVTGNNSKPIAVNDYKRVLVNGNGYIRVLLNDTNTDASQSLVISNQLISGPFHGTSTVNDGDSILYTPERNYCGKDTLTYEVCDSGSVLCGQPILCDTATVYISITPTFEDSLCVFNLPNLPKAFSPNGDGQNDVLYLLGGPFKEVDFKVYNNWGELIFVSKSQSEGWDGKRNGVLQAEGVYVAVVRVVSDDREQKEYNITQDVTLFR